MIKCHNIIILLLLISIFLNVKFIKLIGFTNGLVNYIIIIKQIYLVVINCIFVQIIVNCDCELVIIISIIKLQFSNNFFILHLYLHPKLLYI